MATVDPLLSLLNNTRLQAKDIALYNFLRKLTNSVSSLIGSGKQTGSWTATDDSGAGLTLVTNSADFIKTSDGLVIAFINLTYPVTASGANALIGGLPYSALRLNSIAYPVIIAYQNATLNMHGSIVNGTNKMQLILNTGVTVTNVQLSTFTLLLTAIYRI